VNGFTNLALTKLDVLSGLDEIKVTVDHERNGNGPQDVAVHSSRLENVEPVYETLPGWDDYIRDCRSWAELPQTAKDYVSFIEDFVDVPITYISVGPEREELILRD
jgi:adenylosuccinate synthase